jgi:outer membrane protein assembly factor BamE
MYKSIICLLLMLILSGCSFFSIRKPIIEQGNIITNESVSKLHTGMSPGQVVAIMGAPVVTNIFTPNRMEYVFTYQGSNEPRRETHLTCIFDKGRLKEIRKNHV